MTFREFSGKNVEEAIRTAMKEFASDLSDLDIEILSQGSRGILGVGGEEARILAAPKSAVAAAPSVRPSTASMPEPPSPTSEGETDAEPAPAPRGRGRARAARVTEPAEITPEPVMAEAATNEPEAPDEPSEASAPMVDADDQAAELAAYEVGGERDDDRRRGRRGGRGRNGRERPASAPRERDRERDRPAREPAPFVPAKPLAELSEEERTVLEDAKTVLAELLRLMGINGAWRSRWDTKPRSSTSPAMGSACSSGDAARSSPASSTSST